VKFSSDISGQDKDKFRLIKPILLLLYPSTSYGSNGISNFLARIEKSFFRVICSENMEGKEKNKERRRTSTQILVSPEYVYIPHCVKLMLPFSSIQREI
jgi:hypothetical protein